MNRLRKRLAGGEFLLGTHIQACEPSFTEMLGQCGFDYLWIDTEHTAVDYKTLQMHLIAASSAGCPAVVRVPWNEPYLAKRVLEQGPDGIIFPNITSAGEALKAMDACLYPACGKRGFGPIRAARYGLTAIDEYLKEAEESVCRFIQIEDVKAVRNLEEILSVKGIDGVILGPCDLSGSVGRLGETECELVEELIDETIRICRAKQISVGVSVGGCDPETVLAWKDRGIQFISAGSEYGYIFRGAEKLVSSVRNFLTGE